MSSLTLKQALVRLKNRLMLVQELYEQCYGRVQQTASLNIYISQNSPQSVANQIEQSQYNIDTGMARPLEGIPVAFKDNFCTKGAPTTCASAMLLNYVPPYNATMVSKCLDNGAIVNGKTNMDEFAMGAGSTDSHFGPVKNPWNLVRLLDTEEKAGNLKEAAGQDDNWIVAGGSSGGSAAAVAVGTCLAAFGSDTGGSVRIPASYCGVVGFKPTYGQLSRHGLIPLHNALDTPAICTQTVEDAAIMLNAVAGHDVKDSTTVPDKHTPFTIDPDLDLSNVHVGIPKEYHVPLLDEDMLSLWRNMADTLENAGAKVSQVTLPHFEYYNSCYSVLCACDVASNFNRYDGIEYGLRTGSEESTEELFAQVRLSGLNSVVRGRIMAGNYFLLKRNYESMFVQAQRVRRLVVQDFRNVFNSGVDLLLTPTGVSDAPDYAWFSEESNQARCRLLDSYVLACNLAGLPAVSLPLGSSQRGLPLGLQLIGPMFSESKLLTLGHWLELEAGFKRLSLDFLDDESLTSHQV